MSVSIGGGGSGGIPFRHIAGGSSGMGGTTDPCTCVIVTAAYRLSCATPFAYTLGCLRRLCLHTRAHIVIFTSAECEAEVRAAIHVHTADGVLGGPLARALPLLSPTAAARRGGGGGGGSSSNSGSGSGSGDASTEFARSVHVLQPEEWAAWSWVPHDILAAHTRVWDRVSGGGAACDMSGVVGSLSATPPALAAFRLNKPHFMQLAQGLYNGAHSVEGGRRGVSTFEIDDTGSDGVWWAWVDADTARDDAYVPCLHSAFDTDHLNTLARTYAPLPSTRTRGSGTLHRPSSSESSAEGGGGGGGGGGEVVEDVAARAEEEEEIRRDMVAGRASKEGLTDAVSTPLPPLQQVQQVQQAQQQPATGGGGRTLTPRMLLQVVGTCDVATVRTRHPLTLCRMAAWDAVPPALLSCTVMVGTSCAWDAWMSAYTATLARMVGAWAAWGSAHAEGTPLVAARMPLLATDEPVASSVLLENPSLGIAFCTSRTADTMRACDVHALRADVRWWGGLALWSGAAAPRARELDVLRVGELVHPALRMLSPATRRVSAWYVARAEYGTAGAQLDVTAWVQAMHAHAVHTHAEGVVVNNEALGGCDPAYGMAKVLTVTWHRVRQASTFRLRTGGSGSGGAPLSATSIAAAAAAALGREETLLTEVMTTATGEYESLTWPSDVVQV